MAAENRLLVVTDLDGSLLDADYRWDAALPALHMLTAADCPLVLNSSKTLAEMCTLASELQTKAPIVAENGGLTAIPHNSPLTRSGGISQGSYSVFPRGPTRDEIVRRAHALRTGEGYQFQGFADWNPQEVARRTGLGLAAAQQASERHATEPIVWQDTPERLSQFQDALAPHQIRVVGGGRFLHLMGTQDKADGVRHVQTLYREASPEINWLTVAVGDSPNDQAMLEAADVAVVIPRTDGETLQPQAARIVTATEPGARGWNAAILSLLQDFEIHG